MSPTQQERSEATTTSLVAAARELFAADGYAATSLEAVVERAGVTKGALYHHYAGKRELFAAVFAAEQERLSERVAAAYAESGGDSWESFEAGCRAFVEACQEPGVQRIFLLDAQVALGWETVRRLESGSLETMVLGIERAIEDGCIGAHDPRQLAHLLFGAICETAMVVAREPDQKRALRESVESVGSLLRGLAV